MTHFGSKATPLVHRLGKVRSGRSPSSSRFNRRNAAMLGPRGILSPEIQWYTVRRLVLSRDATFCTPPRCFTSFLIDQGGGGLRATASSHETNAGSGTSPRVNARPKANHASHSESLASSACQSAMSDTYEVGSSEHRAFRAASGPTLRIHSGSPRITAYLVHLRQEISCCVCRLLGG